MTEENTQEAQQEGTPVVQLSLADIAAAVQIIDITTTRGAFEGSEIESVGGVRNRLAEFIDSHGPQEAEAEGATATDESGDPVEVEEV
jgi:hypothetical protein